VLKERGYLTILDDRDAKETTLPALSPEQALTLTRVLPKQHWSKPPERFTEATLIKYLEAKGVGRPSTFASMVSLILRKEFVDKPDRKHLAPTPRGEKLDAELRAHFASIINEGFTAELEAELDRIAENKHAWRSFMATFWTTFTPLLDTAQAGVVPRASRASSAPAPPPRKGRPRKGAAKEATGKGEVQALFDNPPCYRCGALMRRVTSQKNGKEYLCCSRDRASCDFIMEASALQNPPCPLCKAPTRLFPSGTGYGCVRWRKDGKDSCAGIVQACDNKRTG
jgi:DNA topoisomerase-1